MWLTSWWVAWLPNFYGFSHTNCMVLYQTPWTRYRIPWNCIGTSGTPHGIPWNSTIFLEFHGPPRKVHGISWQSMELHHYFMELRGTPWHSMELIRILHGTPFHSMELHGYSMELHGTPWNSMGTPWMIPWISIDFHWFPWNSIEVFHRGSLHYLTGAETELQLVLSSLLCWNLTVLVDR